MAEMTIPFSIGDKIGYINKLSDGRLIFIKDEIKRIVITKAGIQIGKTQHFSTLELEELLTNTEVFTANHLILLSEPFIMDEELESSLDEWVKKANENPEAIKSIWDDLED